MKQITILGSTGSIGKSTLSILNEHPDKFKVVALTARTKVDDLFLQCQQYQPCYAVLEQENQAKQLRERLKTLKSSTQVLSGSQALQEVAALPEVDYVMAAIVGAAGLLPTLAAARAGKRILLANKEALVMSGDLFMQTVKQYNATLLPVDSEHNAIFQCMPPGFQVGQTPVGVDKIILTASGGPFRTLPYDKFENITPEQAIAHPNWSMGAKISTDSATFMNKGLEVIEAHWLFNMPVNDIEVVIHPQSIVHSLVSYQDGSTLAQLGCPDMRTPIAYTLSWPQRIHTKVRRLDLIKAGQLTFTAVDPKRFPCLEMCYTALKMGGNATTILNAANEIAVEAFLQKKIRFTQISKIIETVLSQANLQKITALEDILESDLYARKMTQNCMKTLQG